MNEWEAISFLLKLGMSKISDQTREQRKLQLMTGKDLFFACNCHSFH